MFETLDWLSVRLLVILTIEVSELICTIFTQNVNGH